MATCTFIAGIGTSTAAIPCNAFSTDFIHHCGFAAQDLFYDVIFGVMQCATNAIDSIALREVSTSFKNRSGLAEPLIHSHLGAICIVSMVETLIKSHVFSHSEMNSSIDLRKNDCTSRNSAIQSFSTIDL